MAPTWCRSLRLLRTSLVQTCWKAVETHPGVGFHRLDSQIRQHKMRFVRRFAGAPRPRTLLSKIRTRRRNRSARQAAEYVVERSDGLVSSTMRDVAQRRA